MTRTSISTFLTLMLLTARVSTVAAPATSPAPAAPAAPTTAPASAPTGVKVMSFNIRYLNKRDGEDAWDRRRDFLVATIKAYGPDLLGLQEVVAEQGDFVQQQLPDYGYVGGGRDDGKRAGEASPVLYRKARFDLVASGQFWLSPTPEKVGSKGWDAQLPRIATWAKLTDRTTGRPVFYVNTHWDHVGNVARVESAKLMRQQIDARRDNAAVIVTGDFNSTEDQPQYRTLTRGDPAGLPLADAYRAVHPDVAADEASFNGFKGTTKGKRIDWILTSPELVATRATIDRTSRDGRFPSDHYAVTADLSWKP